MHQLNTKEEPIVRDLQKQAEIAARKNRTSPPRSTKVRLSRGARLHLIDTLSRWTNSGLALLTGASIFIAVAAGRDYPARAAIWLIMMMVTLAFCQKLCHEFRTGETLAAKPFRWRANYTSALTVLSTAFGAGAIITAPRGVVDFNMLQTSAIIMVCAIGASATHIAHGRSAIAVALPASLLALAAIIKSTGVGLIFAAASLFLLVSCIVLFIASRSLQSSVNVKFPYTRLARKDLGNRDALVPAHQFNQKAQAS